MKVEQYAVITDGHIAGFDYPTALSDGTDMFLFGGNTYRIEGLPSGHKLAFITTSATGSVYITPEV